MRCDYFHDTDAYLAYLHFFAKIYKLTKDDFQTLYSGYLINFKPVNEMGTHATERHVFCTLMFHKSCF